MDVVWTVLGIALIALALRDIFDVLFHPLGRGSASRWLMRAIAALARGAARRVPTARLLAGPLIFIAVVAAWAAMLTVGWALIFYPEMPDGFSFAAGLDPAANGSFGDAIYLSLVNLTSLGYGEIAPATPLLRLLCPAETLFGLGLLTASISWLVSIYGAISRRDALAHEVHLCREAEERLGERLVDGDPELLRRLLASFTEQLIASRRDLIHFPITHYFRTEDEDRALSGLLPFLDALADDAGEAGRPRALQVRAQMLRMAIDDFALTLRTRLQMPGETTDAVLGHYHAEHRGR